jgi:hypothetical protein
MIKNTANQSISAVLINLTTGAPVAVGVTTVYVTIDGGVQALGVGTIENEGIGQWTYKPTQAETNGDSLAFLFVNALAISVNLQVYTEPLPGTYPATTPTGAVFEPITWQQLIIDALVEIGSYDAGDIPSPTHIELGRRWLNRVIDQWQARKVYAYNVAFTAYTLTAAHQPHLIGPGLIAPDFNAYRPTRIENAALILNTSTPNVDLPLNIRDDDWWANKRVKALASNVPIDLYPSYAWPNVELYLWPVPNFAYGIRLETWTSVIQVAAGDLLTYFSSPYGYEQALMLTLAEKLCRPMARPTPITLPSDAAHARSIIQMNNDKSPRIASADHGMASRPRGDFNWMSGTIP